MSPLCRSTRRPGSPQKQMSPARAVTIDMIGQAAKSLHSLDGSIRPVRALTFVRTSMRRCYACRWREMFMPEKRIIEKAQRAKRAGKAPTTQAGEFVRGEIRKVRRGEHGARSPQQVIAIGLSKARRAGVALPPPGKGKAKERTRRSAKYAYEAGQRKRKTRRQPRVSRAVLRVLEHEPRSTASRGAISRQARLAASRRTTAQRSAAAGKAIRT